MTQSPAYLVYANRNRNRESDVEWPSQRRRRHLSLEVNDGSLNCGKKMSGMFRCA